MRRVMYCFYFLYFSYSVNGQQNLFNIPSGDITPKNKIFFQQQINVNNFQQQSFKSHLVYGLGKGWEVGINALNMNFDWELKPTFRASRPPLSSTPFYPVGVVTAQKQWTASDHLSFNLGTQVGTNLSPSIENKRITNFTYGLAQYHLNDNFKAIAGLYTTDKRLVGSGNKNGFFVGTEVHLSKKWLFMADHISGNNKNSVSVFGFTYNVNSKFQICGGWQLPNRGSIETQAFVFEINLFNF